MVAPEVSGKRIPFRSLAILGAMLAPLILPVVVVTGAKAMGGREALFFPLALGLPFLVGEAFLWAGASNSKVRMRLLLGYVVIYPLLLLVLWAILFIGLKLKIA